MPIIRVARYIRVCLIWYNCSSMKLLVLIICYVVGLGPLCSQSTVDWVRSLGGSNEDGVQGLLADAASNSYGVGYFRDTLANMISKGGSDALVFKYDKNGYKIWQTSLGSTGEDAANDLALDKHANLFVCGYFRDGSILFNNDSLPNYGASDAFVCKLDSSGIVQWVISMHSPANEIATAITCDENGNAYVVGTFQDSIRLQQQTIYGLGGINNFVLKLDVSGHLIWYDVLSTPTIDNLQSIELGPSQSVYLTGFFRDVFIRDNDTLYAFGQHDIFLAKYNSTGQFEFWKNFGGLASDFAYAMTVDTNAVYLAGMFVDSAFFDQLILLSTGELDVCLMRCGLDGSVQWVRSIGGFDDSKPYGLSLGRASLWLVGYYDGIAWSGTDSINSRDSRHAPSDIFVAQFDKNGQAIDLKSYGGVQIDYATAIDCVDSTLYIAGLVQDSAYFDSTLIVCQGGSSDIFLLKLLSQQAVSIVPIADPIERYKLYPNPVTQTVYLEFKLNKSMDCRIVLVDSRGRLIDQVYEGVKGDLFHRFQYDLNHLTPGLYYFIINTAGTKSYLPCVKAG